VNLTVLHEVLSEAQLSRARAILEVGPWRDGKQTAGAEAARAKSNLQLESGSSAHAQLSEMMKQAMTACESFKQLALPRRMSMPLFSRYDEGMEYGPHTDDAYRTHEHLRTDLAVTIFLSSKESYEGGELTIGDTAIKLSAGDAVVYPATTIHRVSKVTRGSRLACVFWVQSLIRDDAQREILLTLQRVSARLSGDAAASLALSRVQQNLLRMWLDP
jgi:PKHD-type hydroxylase